MIDILITIIILCLVFGLLFYLVQMLPIPAPFDTILRVCVILICILVIVGLFFGGGEYLPSLHLRR